MFRRILTATTLTAATLTGLAVPTVAEAHPPIVRDSRFEVLVREGHRHHGWRVYGSYCNRWEADRAAEQLRCRGFQVMVRGC